MFLIMKACMTRNRAASINSSSTSPPSGYQVDGLPLARRLVVRRRVFEHNSESCYQILIKFRYFLNYTDLTNATDTSRIPESFDTVLVDGALFHLYMFKDNLESANAAYAAFTSGLKDLQTLFINSFESIRDTRVKF